MPPLAEMLVNESDPPVLDSETAVPVVVATITSLTLTPVMAATGSFIPVLVVELIESPLTVALVLSVTVLPRLVVGALVFIAGSVLV